MSSPSVLAVVINWRRPFNIPQVLAALKGQTTPVVSVLVECAYATEHVCQAWRLFDDVIRLGKTNLGPCSRFIPAMAYPGFEYIFFAVDDYVPGPQCVEVMVRTATSLGNRFSTIGQDGRLVEGGHIVKRRVQMLEGECAKVDVSTTSELVRQDLIPQAIQFRDRMAAADPAISLFEDDLILSMGLQLATGFPSYLTPAGPAEESWRTKGLADDCALSARPNHREIRDQFVVTSKGLGWRSLAC